MNILSIMHEDLKTQREGIFAQEFGALFIFRLAHPRMHCNIRFVRILWRIVNVFLQKWIEVITGISIPETTVIGRRLNIEHFGGIIIHGNVVIGDDCQIRQGVTIGNRGDDEPHGAPTIGDRVQIGAGAKLIGRIVIGNDVKIGANSVVITDIPPDSVAVGVPAKIIAKVSV
jgi:serine O-acetyltransferase